MGQGTND